MREYSNYQQFHVHYKVHPITSVSISWTFGSHVKRLWVAATDDSVRMLEKKTRSDLSGHWSTGRCSETTVFFKELLADQCRWHWKRQCWCQHVTQLWKSSEDLDQLSSWKLRLGMLCTADLKLPPKLSGNVLQRDLCSSCKRLVGLHDIGLCLNIFCLFPICQVSVSRFLRKSMSGHPETRTNTKLMPEYLPDRITERRKGASNWYVMVGIARSNLFLLVLVT